MDDPTNPFRQQPAHVLNDAEHSDTTNLLSSQLKALSDWANDRTPLAIKLSDDKERKNCVAVARRFYENVLNSFPSPREHSWDAIHEKIALVEASFAVFLRVGAAFSGEQDFRQLSRQFFIRIFSTCWTLDDWIDASEIQTSASLSVSTPRELYKQGETACTGLLRAWFGCVQTSSEGVCGWQVAKEIVVECLALCQDLLNEPPADGPVRVRLFETPRIQPVGSSETDQMNTESILLDHRARCPLLLSSLLKIILESVTQPSLSDWFLADALRGALDCASQSFHFFISPLCITSGQKRSRALARLTSAMVTDSLSSSTRCGIAEVMRVYLLTRQLSEGPNDDWLHEQVTLHRIYSATLPVSPAPADIQTILTILDSEQWEVKGDTLRAFAATYLAKSVPQLDVGFLRAVKARLSRNSSAVQYFELLGIVQQRLEALHNASEDVAMAAPEDRPVDKCAWRQELKRVVEALIAPETLSWMDDGDSLADGPFVARALSDVDTRFRQRLDGLTAEVRVILAKQLARLPCALARHLNSPCPAAPSRTAVACIPTGLRVAIMLLIGTEKEVTSMVSKTVYDALIRVIRHHTSGFGPAIVEPMSELAIKGMKNPDRSVRLSAGRCLAELVRMLQDKGTQGAQLIEPMFNNIDAIFLRYADRLKETTLITTGLIARQANSDILYRALLCLVTHLGNSNPVIQGTAFMQLSSVVDSKGKSRYGLMKPYRDQIAIYIVDHLATLPALLKEYCAFLGVSTNEFISSTLDTVVPHLFATCNGAALQLVAIEQSCDVAQLFWEKEAKIIAHAYMITVPGQRQRIINFILTFFKTSARQGVSVPDLLKCNIVDIVSELVMKMGDEDDTVVQAAVHGLIRVEDTLNNPVAPTQPSTGRTSGVFLETHILGVLTHLVEILEDTKEKRTLQEKKCVCRAVGKIVRQIGAPVSTIAPQIMAMLQTMLAMSELRDATLESWEVFLRVLEPADIGPYIGPTGAAFLTAWPTLSWHARASVKSCLHYLVVEAGESMKQYLDELVDLTSTPELREIGQRLAQMRTEWTPEQTLDKLLDRIASENLSVACRAMEELRAFLLQDDEEFIRSLTSGDFFDFSVGRVCSALIAASCRDGDGADTLRMLAFDCIGIMGAVDPYRFDLDSQNPRTIVGPNFEDDSDMMTFVIHLIRDVLAGAYRSTSDMQYQRDLAYAIQELMQTCGFSVSLVTPGSNASVSIKVRTRWNQLPKSVMETVTPLLTSKYKLVAPDTPRSTQRPIYLTQPTYREWMQTWMSNLIPEATGQKASKIFDVFRGVVRNRDVGVARYLLPHLVLHILTSGTTQAANNIRSELLAILTDQVDPASTSSPDKKELSAQTVFMVMDHINSWVRTARQEIAASTKKKRTRDGDNGHPKQKPLSKVNSILSNIDQKLMARAALQCKAYARALMCFEQQVVNMSSLKQDAELQESYERLHEIYAQLDEPDGMQGTSTLIISPSLEHQIRQHESIGQWTSAQSCWEVNLQQNPHDLKSHIGLLCCLRHLGHYDTMRTHVEGLVSRHPEWKPSLIGYQIESECIVGAWDKVNALVQQTDDESAPVVMGRILLAMREGNQSAILSELAVARRSLGSPILAVGGKGYSRCYDAVIDLHLVHELEIIYRETMSCRPSQDNETSKRFDQLSRRLSARLESTLPSIRTREPILSIRRAAFGLASAYHRRAKEVIGQSWLHSAKLARKAGYWQTAYSAVLQAQHSTPVFTTIESAKLEKASGDPIRALQELDNYYRISKARPSQDVIDLTDEAKPSEPNLLQGKAFILRARWMCDTNRYEGRYLLGLFEEANQLLNWESGQFHWGDFQDQCFKELPQEPKANYIERGNRMNLMTIRCFAEAIKLGCKYTYQTVPRLLTLWLDMGMQDPIDTKLVNSATKAVLKSFQSSAPYKWYTAFPQILSRVGHPDGTIFDALQKMILGVVSTYPQQSLWLFSSVIHSEDIDRKTRGQKIVKELQGNLGRLVGEYSDIEAHLLQLCNREPRKDSEGKIIQSLTMKDFPRLKSVHRSNILVPCQESLSASLPPSVEGANFSPFPMNLPTISKFTDEIEVMKSLAHPKKFAVVGSDGLTYRFLGKPKDDLRKDARLMDFNTIINKFLKSDSDSRRRQLHIRTYCVVPLNEDCGLIEWVPYTKPMRQILTTLYSRHRIEPWGTKLADEWEKMTRANVKDAARMFETVVLPMFPPVFHDWFIETFPEPTAWLTSRLAYTRTAAVMCMVGYILGLGDRHTENILLDVMTGDMIHVDFNCLFERGLKLQTPERVPFRLTQNVVDGFGVTGVEGVFRVACELAMHILRHNKDCLRTVLDAFIHDPLIEFRDEKKLLDRAALEASRKSVTARTAAALAAGHKGKGKSTGLEENPQVRVDDLARDALARISRKLQGLFVAYREPGMARALKSEPDKEVPTNSLVDMLIREATNNSHLAKMYAGWAPWH